MKIELKPEETFIIVTFLQAYWISLLVFKLLLLPLIVVISLGAIIFYFMVQKYFHIKISELSCRKLAKEKEAFLHIFFFGSRIIIALVTILFPANILYSFLPLGNTSIIFSHETGLNISYLLMALGGLGYIDSELSRIWCFNPFFKIFEEILNIFVVYCTILL